MAGTTNRSCCEMNFQGLYLIDLRLADSTDGEVKLNIDVLIGADFYWDFVSKEIIRGGNKDPVTVRTSLGLVLSGCIGTTTTSATQLTTHVMRTNIENEEVAVVNEEERLDELVRNFWRIDDINDPESSDEKVMEEFAENIQFENGRYVVSLPWKDTTDIIPDNFMLCKARLTSLLNRLRKNPELFKKYDSIIEEQYRNGIIEKVTQNIEETGSVHYIPHREVIREDRDTTKIRIVYGCDAN